MNQIQSGRSVQKLALTHLRGVGALRLSCNLATVIIICITIKSADAIALTCPPYTYTFSNGTTADAPQVNTNFTEILTCANTLLAPLDAPNFTGRSRFTGILTDTTPGDTINFMFLQPTLSPPGSSGTNFVGLSVIQTFESGYSFTGANTEAPTASVFENFIVDSGSIAEASGGAFTGMVIGPDATSLGTVTQLQAARFTPVISFDNSLTTTITRAIGVRVLNSQKDDLNLVGQAGVAIDPISGATNNTALLMGQTSVPSGTFAIYNASASNNYFAGNLGIGVTNPANSLDVSGRIKVGTFASATATHVCQSSGVLSTCSSSLRYKENVKSANLGLSEVEKLRPVTFKWKGRNEKDFGFIAEEVAKVDPLFVTYKDGNIEGVKYDQLTAVLTRAIQEQQAQIRDLVTQTSRQASTLEKLKIEIRALRDRAHVRTARN